MLAPNTDTSHGRKYFLKPFKETTCFRHIHIIWRAQGVPSHMTSSVTMFSGFLLRYFDFHPSYIIFHHWPFVHLGMKVKHWQNILWGGEGVLAPRKQAGFNESNALVTPSSCRTITVMITSLISKIYRVIEWNPALYDHMTNRNASLKESSAGNSFSFKSYFLAHWHVCFS